MPYYRLEPVAENIDKSDWERSTYQGICHVSAENEKLARDFVHGEFNKAAGKEGPGSLVKNSPWLRADLVDCVEVASITGPLPPEGVVITPNEDPENPEKNP